MRYCFTLLLLNTFSLWSQDRLNDENYYNNFPIEEMILGEWYLEKIEIVGLNNNDSSSIISIESGKDRIVFHDNTYMTLPDTASSRFYRPSYEFHYKIEKSDYDIFYEIVLTNKRGKNRLSSYTVVLYTFETLVLEQFEVNLRLGEKHTKTRYSYKRKSSTEPTIIGKWVLDDTVNFYFNDANDNTWHIFRSYNSLNQDSLNRLKVKTVVEFELENYYSMTSISESVSKVLDGVYLGGTFILDSSNNKIYLISNTIDVYDYLFEGENTLKIKYHNSR